MAKSFITCMNHMFDINQIGNLAWIPLHSFIKSPQFEGKLKIRGFLSSFLHCSKPGAVYVKSSLHHFKLIQACFINILLLHYVQLWMQQTDRYTKHDEQCLTWRSHRSCDFTWHMSGDKSIWPMSAEHTMMELIRMWFDIFQYILPHITVYLRETLSFIQVLTATDSHCRDACHAAGSRTVNDPVSHSALKLYCAGQSLDQSKRHLLKA